MKKTKFRRVVRISGLVVILLLGMAVLVYPYQNSGVKAKLTASVTVDSQYTGNWDPVDSLVGVCADSCRYEVVVEGIAELTPFSPVLYVGMGRDSANRVSAALAATTGQTHTNIDTFIVGCYEGWPRDAGKIRMPFTFTYNDSTAAALTDTFYFNCATRGKGAPITIRDLRVKFIQYH